MAGLRLATDEANVFAHAFTAACRKHRHESCGAHCRRHNLDYGPTFARSAPSRRCPTAATSPNCASDAMRTGLTVTPTVVDLRSGSTNKTSAPALPAQRGFHAGLSANERNERHGPLLCGR